ncbi:hypothetical protein A2U01_0084140, partial [Trifolium medium]|nr:hypothetical protein [Trifolium medium]
LTVVAAKPPSISSTHHRRRWLQNTRDRDEADREKPPETAAVKAGTAFAGQSKDGREVEVRVFEMKK